jgi:3-oxoacyl-[acyl-carrier protein] reductase
MFDIDLNGKVVVVTGAAGRLGRQVVRRFAGQGATIAAVVRGEEQAHDIPFPPDAEGWAFPADVTDERMVAACFDQIGGQFGRIDVLIQAVGSWETRPLLETSLDDWQKMLRLNLDATFLCFREAARFMSGGGRLIAFASGQGADRGRAGQGGYAAAKAGVIRLVEAAAEELADRDISAHAVAPSTIVFDDESDQSGVHVDDVVDLCLYLCTPPARALSGQAMRLYGGGG